jgi:hypothetical protein
MHPSSVLAEGVDFPHGITGLKRFCHLTQSFMFRKTVFEPQIIGALPSSGCVSAMMEGSEPYA